MSGFDLNDLIHETVEETGLADPHEIAAVIVIPEEHLADATRQMLTSYVSDYLRKGRQMAMNDRRGEGSGPSTRVGVSRWAKFTPELLDSSVSVRGERKLLGDCTVEDLETIASEYSTRAEQLVAYAQRFSDLAKRLRISGAATLREATTAGPVQIAAAA